MLKLNPKHMAELALIRGIPDFHLDRKMKKGRLKNLYKQLIKQIDQGLRKFVFVSDSEKKQAENILIEFGKKTGWSNTNRHIMAHISFLLAMIEESEFHYNEKIIVLLNEISDYFERAGNHPIQTDMMGELAVNTWMEL